MGVGRHRDEYLQNVILPHSSSPPPRARVNNNNNNNNDDRRADTEDEEGSSVQQQQQQQQQQHVPRPRILGPRDAISFAFFFLFVFLDIFHGRGIKFPNEGVEHQLGRELVKERQQRIKAE